MRLHKIGSFAKFGTMATVAIAPMKVPAKRYTPRLRDAPAEVCETIYTVMIAQNGRGSPIRSEM